MTISTNSHSSANLTKHSKPVVFSGFENSNNNRSDRCIFSKEFPRLPPPSSRKVLALHTKSYPQSQKVACANYQLLYLLGGAIQNAIGYHCASQPSSAFFTQVTQLCLRGRHFAAVSSLIPTLPTARHGTTLPDTAFCKTSCHYEA